MTFAAPPGVFRTLHPLVLASASPRRQAFLRDLGLECRVVRPPQSAEPLPGAGEPPEAFAARAAAAKAGAVHAAIAAAARESGGTCAAVLGADTVVYSEDGILGKPANPEEALDFLKRLAGREHMVRTACCLRLECGRAVSFYGEACVRMGVWPEAVLKSYAESGEGLDKAGGYAVQGVGAFLVERVTGSWSAVIGLPVAETIGALFAEGLIGTQGTL